MAVPSITEVKTVLPAIVSTVLLGLLAVTEVDLGVLN